MLGRSAIHGLLSALQGSLTGAAAWLRQFQRSLRTNLAPRIADHPTDAEQDDYAAKHTGDAIHGRHNGIWRSAASDQSQDKCDAALSADVGPLGGAMMKLSE
jgi:hypothetical protein